MILEAVENGADPLTWWDRNSAAVWVLVGTAVSGLIALLVDWRRRRHQDGRDRDQRLRDGYGRVIACALDFHAAHQLRNPKKDSLAGVLAAARNHYGVTESGPDEVDVYIARRVEETSVAVQVAIAQARPESDRQMALHLDRLSVAVRLRRGAKGLGEEWARLGGKGSPSVPYEVEVFTDAMRKRFGGETSGVTRRAYETEVFAEAKDANPERKPDTSAGDES